MISKINLYRLFLLSMYFAFLIWYSGSGDKMTPTEIKRGIDTLKAYALENEEVSSFYGTDNTIDSLNTMALTDDGGEFIMVNLIKYRDIAKYPENSKWSNDTDPMIAEQRYFEGLKMFRKVGHPIFFSKVVSKFIDDSDSGEWDVVILVRYRSMRDLFNMAIDAAVSGNSIHKWASIEKTNVFPVKSQISLFLPKFFITLLFLLVAYIPALIKRAHQK